MENKIQFVGSGSAFSYENGQNNAILYTIGEGETQEAMLIDAGTQWHSMILKVYSKTVADFLKENNVTKLFVTHLHADHIGGIEEIGFLTRFIPGLNKIEIIAPSKILEDLWEKSLKGGMESLDFGQLSPEEEVRPIGLDSYFVPNYLSDNIGVELPGKIMVEAFTTSHVANRMGSKASCGVFITSKDKKTVYTSDTQFCPSQLLSMYKKADQIFHDCETMPFKSK